MSNEAAKAIRAELKAQQGIRKEAEDQEARLERALDALEKPTRQERGPRVPMEKRAEEALAYLRRQCSGARVSLREIVENTEIPQTSMYKAAEILRDNGDIILHSKNGHIGIDDEVEIKHQHQEGSRKSLSIRPGQPVDASEA